MIIWPLFGTTNQIMAALSLAIITVILLRKRRLAVVTLIPFALVLSMSLLALVVQLGTFYRDGNWLLLVLDVIILVSALFVTVESIRAMLSARHQVDPDEEDAGLQTSDTSA